MRHILVAGTQPFRSSSMIKNGYQSLTSSWRDIGSWTADTQNHPGSVVNGHGILAQGDIASANITAGIGFQISAGAGGPQQAVRILVNGNVVSTGSTVGGWSGTLSATASISLTVGDRVSVQGWSTHGATVLSGAGSFVRIEAA
ncbi:hypothetical protein [Nocardia sp. NPDC004415]